MQHHYTKAFNLDTWCSVWLRKAGDPNTRLLWCWLCRVSESFWLYIWLRVWEAHGQSEGIWVKVPQVCRRRFESFCTKVRFFYGCCCGCGCVLVVVARVGGLFTDVRWMPYYCIVLLSLCCIDAMFTIQLKQPSEAISDWIAPPFFVLLRKWETNGRRVYWLCLRHRSKWIQPEAVGRLDTKSCWLFWYSVVCISFLDEMQFDGKSWSPFVLARLERPAWFSEEMFFFLPFCISFVHQTRAIQRVDMMFKTPGVFRDMAKLLILGVVTTLCTAGGQRCSWRSFPPCISFALWEMTCWFPLLPCCTSCT